MSKFEVNGVEWTEIDTRTKAIIITIILFFLGGVSTGIIALLFAEEISLKLLGTVLLIVMLKIFKPKVEWKR